MRLCESGAHSGHGTLCSRVAVPRHPLLPIDMSSSSFHVSHSSHIGLSRSLQPSFFFSAGVHSHRPPFAAPQSGLTSGHLFSFPRPPSLLLSHFLIFHLPLRFQSPLAPRVCVVHQFLGVIARPPTAQPSAAGAMFRQLRTRPRRVRQLYGSSIATPRVRQLHSGSGPRRAHLVGSSE